MRPLRWQRQLGLLVALAGAALIWQLGPVWSPAWPLGFLIVALGLYLMRTAPEDMRGS